MALVDVNLAASATNKPPSGMLFSEAIADEAKRNPAVAQMKDNANGAGSSTNPKK